LLLSVCVTCTPDFMLAARSINKNQLIPGNALMMLLEPRRWNTGGGWLMTAGLSLP
jgi:hypothetical protein